MDTETIEKIADSVAEKLKKEHCVAFDPETRFSIHTLHRAMLESKATQGDVVMSFSIGKNLRESLDEGAKKILRGLLLLGLIVIAVLSIKALGTWDAIKSIGR